MSLPFSVLFSDSASVLLLGGSVFLDAVFPTFTSGSPLGFSSGLPSGFPSVTVSDAGVPVTPSSFCTSGSFLLVSFVPSLAVEDSVFVFVTG